MKPQAPTEPITRQELSEKVGPNYLKQMFRLIPDLEDLPVYPPENQTLHTILEIHRRRQTGPVKTIKGVIAAMCEEYQQQEEQSQAADAINQEDGVAGTGEITYRKSHQIAEPAQQSFISTTSSYYKSLATGGAAVGVVGAQVFHASAQKAFTHTAAKLLQEDANVNTQQLGSLAVDAANAIDVDIEKMVGAIKASPEAGNLNFSPAHRTPVGLGFMPKVFAQGKDSPNGKVIEGKTQRQILLSFNPNVSED
jgi:hypothetical protein